VRAEYSFLRRKRLPRTAGIRAGRRFATAWSDAPPAVELRQLEWLVILDGDTMRLRILILSAWLATASAMTCSAAEENPSEKQDAKDVGHAVGELAHDVGHSAKQRR
jgi:hypothetical protein